jgi:hypothetical protein
VTHCWPRATDRTSSTSRTRAVVMPADHPPGLRRNRANSRSGTRTKTVLTEIAPSSAPHRSTCLRYAVRSRLSLAGTANSTPAFTSGHHQVRHDTPGCGYYQLERAVGKATGKRCMKRQLSDTVYRGLVRNAHTNIETAQDDTQGRLQHPARPAQLLPPALRRSRPPGPAVTDTTNPTPRST